MERVQFQQEQMLEELKDLVEKNLFTEKEIKQIMKKRTAFETALVRRVAKKSDFLRYASYEMGLEQLRRKRAARMKVESKVPSISDFALVRRQFNIFERALKKFKSDVGLWIQYIQLAKREGARALVGRITARAIQLNPNQPALYIVAASHELDHQSHSAARTLLQRGLRLNEESVELWREYVKMELGFIENLRRRWDVLGIEESDGGPDEGIKYSNVTAVPRGTEEDPTKKEHAGAGSRRGIMQGGIVKSVMSSAVQAIPRMEMFSELDDLVSSYPLEPSVREALQEHLYLLLRSALPQDGRAVRLLACRFLRSKMSGEELVEGLRRANEEMVSAARVEMREEVVDAYAGFVQEWCGSSIDANLKEYLISSVRSLTSQKNGRRSPSLLAVHIKLMVEFEQEGLGPARVLEMARKYTARAPTAARVWLARLEAEKRLGVSREEVSAAWAEARRQVEGTEEEVGEVWMWGLSAEEEGEERRVIHEGLLKESMCQGSLSLHELLLMAYIRLVHAVAQTGADPHSTWQAAVQHIASACAPSPRVWRGMYELAAGCSPAVREAVLREWAIHDGGRAGSAVDGSSASGSFGSHFDLAGSESGPAVSQ